MPNTTCSKCNRRTLGKYSHTRESSNQQMCFIKRQYFLDEVDGIFFVAFTHRLISSHLIIPSPLIISSHLLSSSHLSLITGLLGRVTFDDF